METFVDFFTGLAGRIQSTIEALNIDVDKIINLLRYDPTQPLMFNTVNDRSITTGGSAVENMKLRAKLMRLV